MADIVYHLNADDEVVFVNEAWSRFASANGGDVLLPSKVLQRRLWDFIADASTRHIYRTLFERVRSRGETVRLTFRCDAPALGALGSGQPNPRMQPTVRVADAPLECVSF